MNEIKFRTISCNGTWYIQKQKESDWQFLTYWAGSYFMWGKERDTDYSFTSEERAASLIKERLIPYYKPNIKIGKVYTGKLLSEKEECMFELMNKMLSLEKAGKVEEAKEINKKLLGLHGLENKPEANIMNYRVRGFLKYLFH